MISTSAEAYARWASGICGSPRAGGSSHTICYPSRAVGLILDLTVVALALVVIGSLALLAWTLAISAVRAERRALAGVTDARRSIADAEARLRISAARATAALEDLRQRTEPRPGEQRDI
jgi:hypothetical protein